MKPKISESTLLLGIIGLAVAIGLIGFAVYFLRAW